MENLTTNKEKNTVRLPKSFLPQKYDLKIYLDIKNLEYEFKYFIEMEVTEDNKKMLILNANLENYKIKKVVLSKFDHISDHYGEPLEAKYMPCKDVRSLLSSIVLDNEKLIADLSNEITVSNKLTKLFEFISQNKSEEEVAKYKEYILYEDFELIDYLFNPKNKLNIIEESIYIPISGELSPVKGDKLKVYFEVEGGIVLSSKKACGLYFSIFGNDAKLLDKPEEFMKKWKDDASNEELLKHGVICALNEPVDCRTYMPAFDEPCFKSKFKVEISVDKKYATQGTFFKVLANGDEYDRTVDEETGRCTYFFSESPLMSIYLLTFVVGNYEYLESMTGPTRLRVFTPVGKQVEGSFAMETAMKALEFYQNYFKIPYSFPKIDLVPVPDMDYRAMENWGCIVYLNYALMANKFLDIKERKNIARTNTHELSHMWFGNLVTMDWWDDIWLNEGFARFMEFECINEIKPEFEIWSKYIELIYQNAMEIDERPTTHPIRCIVPSPRQLADIFDTISYAKGASIIRMLSFYVGKDKFRSAIMAYLEKFQYQNTKTKDLWDTFKEVLGVDVEPVMDSWLNLSGHPKVDVDLIKTDENELVELVLTQSPFPVNYNKNNPDPLWKIPIFICTKDQEYTFLMEERTMKFNLVKDLNVTYEDLLTGQNFIKVNSDMQGFYRVYYTNSQLIQAILNTANKSAITKLDICGLLTDYLAVKDYKTCFNILTSVKPINDYLILFYAMKVYHSIKEVAFQYTCFKDLLVQDEEKYKNKWEELVTIQDKVNKFYVSLVDVDKEMLKEKIYLKDSSAYMNERDDEFHDFVLQIYAFMGKDQELIKFIVENFEKWHPNLHKNLKYFTYSCVNNFAYSVFGDTEIESRLNDLLTNEYTENFYSISLQGRSYFKSSLVNLESASDEMIYKFASKYRTDYHYRNLYFRGLSMFKAYPNSRKKFLDCYINMIKEKYWLETEYEEMTWNEVLSVGTNRIAFNEVPQLLGDIYDDDLRQIVIDYILRELKSVNPETDNSDAQFLPIIEVGRPTADYCKNANSTLKQVLEYFKEI